MTTKSEKLGLVLPDEGDFYDIRIFNENFNKIDSAYEMFEDNSCSISEDGNTIIETYPSGKRVTQSNELGTYIVESVYDTENVLIARSVTNVQGNQIHETKQEIIREVAL